MNLAEGIRYCTMLPSIEAYGEEEYPVPTYRGEPPAIQTYNVAQFAGDVINHRICAPFTPTPERVKALENE